MKSVVIIFSGFLSLALGATLPPVDSSLESCGKNEHMDWINGCDREKTCDYLKNEEPMNCWPMPAMYVCRCKEGFYRNFLGECISEEQCIQCSKPNEFFSCNSACDTECKNIQTQNRTHCPIKSLVCNKKCYCEDGYARDDSGNCITADQCGKDLLVPTGTKSTP